MVRYTAQSPVQWEDSPSLLAFIDVPGRAVPLGAVSACLADPSASQAPSSLPLPADQKECPPGHRYSPARGEKWGPWASGPLSCEFLMPSGPAQARSPVASNVGVLLCTSTLWLGTPTSS